MGGGNSIQMRSSIVGSTTLEEEVKKSYGRKAMIVVYEHAL